MLADLSYLFLMEGRGSPCPCQLSWAETPLSQARAEIKRQCIELLPVKQYPVTQVVLLMLLVLTELDMVSF